MRMPKMAVAAVALAAATSVALPAGAASASTARGTLQICNHSGFTFDLYAEGPSIRTDDLGNWDECTAWSRVRRGSYDIGYLVHLQDAGANHPVQDFVDFLLRTKRSGHVVYKSWHVNAPFYSTTFNAESKTYVAKNTKTKIDIFADVS